MSCLQSDYQKFFVLEAYQKKHFFHIFLHLKNNLIISFLRAVKFNVIFFFLSSSVKAIMQFCKITVADRTFLGYIVLLSESIVLTSAKCRLL